MRRCTLTVFKPLLYNRIIDIGQDLQLVQVFLHTDELPLLGCFATAFRWVEVSSSSDSLTLDFYLLELFGSVCFDDLEGFLEALVWEVLEGDV